MQVPWVVRRLQVVVGARTHSLLIFSFLSSDTLLEEPWSEWLPGEENGVPAQWASATGWWVEAYEAHWDNRQLTSGADVLIDRSSSEFRFNCSLWIFYLCQGRVFVFCFFFQFFHFFMYMYFNSNQYLRLGSPAMCRAWKTPGGRCTTGSGLRGHDIFCWKRRLFFSLFFSCINEQ